MGQAAGLSNGEKRRRFLKKDKNLCNQRAKSGFSELSEKRLWKKL
jgi:hypothetical protein